jgi:Flp pilus assembly protein TadG
MSCPLVRRARTPRRGVAAVELAILLPLLAFLFVAAVDFGRVFYPYLTITNCAYNGAQYGSLDPNHAADPAGIEAAALKDATNLSPTPAVTSALTVDDDGNPAVQVTVTYAFQTVTRFPGVPNSMNITRTVQMRVAPTAPRSNAVAQNL